MPRVDWGISTKDAQNFDREKQFAPYRGKQPPNAVYTWRITQLKFSAGTGEKYPQLRIGLELVPQDSSEKPFKGFRILEFRSVASHTPFAYVPFMDAIGVTEHDFVNKTISDSEGNIQRIGTWKNTGDVEILGQLKDGKDQHNNPRKEIGWIGPLDELDDEGDDEPDDDEYADDDEDESDGEDYADDEEDYDDEPPKRKQPSKLRGGRAGTTGRSR